MGSTCTAILFAQGRAHLAHVGDSQAYLIRKSQIRRLTTDHTVAESKLQCGILTAEEARTSPQRNMLIRAVGANPEVEIELIKPIVTITNDVFLLCSDGLTEFVSMDEIKDGIAKYPLERTCQVLVNIANNRGGTDNITVQVAQVMGKTFTISHFLRYIKNLFLPIHKLQ